MKTFSLNKRTEKLLHTDPECFIEKAIINFARSNPTNCLDCFGNEPIFEKPLVGFADGNDQLFNEYKKVVHENHLLPREVLELHLSEKQKTQSHNLENVSVISFVFPINRKTIKNNAMEKEGPSLRWNHTRWKGQAFINELSNYLISVLEEMGYCAVAPELENYFKIFLLPDGFSSNWSQRHAAYAAGLGTFSLNEGFITAKGLAMRCGSVVTNLKLKPSVRPYTNYLENCLFYTTGKCGKCIRRCPGGALSKTGHDKTKCFKILYEHKRQGIDGAYEPGFIGSHAGCGLCQTGVPCAGRIPLRNLRNKRCA
jgi:epoxyqueuosine reductase QueG